MVATNVVLLAVRGALRLGGVARQAFVESTRKREMVLPLPAVDMNATDGTAHTFFTGKGKKYVQAGTRLADIRSRFPSIDEEEKKEYIGAYREIYPLHSAKGKPVQSGDEHIDADSLMALVTIRQWEAGDEGEPKPYHRVAGALVDVAVDYFASTPGAISGDSKQARVLTSFVLALDKISFEELAVEKDVLERLTSRLLIAALDTIGEQSEVVSSDPRVQELVQVATKQLTIDLGNRIDAVGDDLNDREDLESWGEMVFRSLISSAGRSVVSEPERFLGVGKAHGALITNIGTTLIDLSIQDDDLDFRRAFGREGLDDFVQAALETLGDHPELVTGDSEALGAVLAGVSSALAQEDNLLSKDILPEAARLVLVHTAGNLELIWPEAKERPEKQALLVAARETLEVLGAPLPKGPEGNKLTWRLKFGRDEVLSVLDATLDELSGNPAWVAAVLEDIESETVAVAIEAALTALRENADERLSKQTAADVLSAVVTAVALRAEFLDEVTGGKPFVSRVIEIIIGEIFDQDVDEAAQWQLLRGEAIVVFVSAAFQVMAKQAGDDIGDELLAKLETFVSDKLQALAKGEALDLEALEAEFQALLEKEED